MSYLGSSAAPIPVAFSGVRNQSFSGTGLVSLFTLNRAVQAVTDIEVIVNNVQQSPFDGSYSIVNNGLGLQFSENPSAGTNNIYVIYRDQPLGSLYDTGAVRKAGDTMTGTLTVGGNVLASPNAGGSRVFGVSGSTNTTVVLQAGAASGSGPNLELTADHYAYLDSNTTKFRSTDASLVYGGFDTAGRWTMPNQPGFSAYTDIERQWNSNAFGPVVFEQTRYNVGNHYNPATGIFTAPIAGKYWVSSWIMWMSEPSFTFIYLSPRVNGTGAFEFMRQGDRADYSTFGGGMTLNLQANDQVRIDLGLAGVDSGYLRAGVSMNQFEIRLVG